MSSTFRRSVLSWFFRFVQVAVLLLVVVSCLEAQFVMNQGQYPPDVRMVARSGPGTLWLLERALVLQTFEGRRTCAVELAFEDCDEPVVEGCRLSDAVWNFYFGDDPRRWREDVPAYEEAYYRGVYPGIDLRLYYDHGAPRYDFELEPGADPSRISLRVRGGRGLCVDDSGALVIATALGEIRQSAPRVFQKDGEPIDGAFRIDSWDHYGFEISSRDRGLPIVIDPALTYSTYIGGSGADNGDEDFSGRVAIGPDGSTYSFVTTESLDYPVTDGSVITGDCDLGITKLNASGTAVVYSTLIGGSNTDEAWGIKVAADSNAYLTGYSVSSDFPTTPGAHTPSNMASQIVGYVARLNATGKIAASTAIDYGRGFCVDFYNDYPSSAWDPSSCPGSSTGLFLVVSGVAYAADFETTVGALDSSFNPFSAAGGGVALDAFVRVYTRDLECLPYSTFIGGDEFDETYDLAVSPNGIVHIVGSAGAGRTEATEAFDAAHHFPVKSATGTIDDVFDSIFVESPSPLSEGYLLAFDPTPGTPDPAHDGMAWDKLVFSTLLGGPNGDGGSLEYAFSVDLDASGNVLVGGTTASDAFPTLNPIAGPIGMAADAPGTAFDDHDGFIAEFTSTGEPLFCSYFSGHDLEQLSTAGLRYEWVYGIRADKRRPDVFWVAGQTESTSYTTDVPPAALVGSFQPTSGGDFDLFVARLSHTTGAPVIEYFTFVGGSQYESQKSLEVDRFGALIVAGYSESANFPTTAGAHQASFAGGSSDAVFARFEISEPFIRGDVDHDGDVDLADVDYLRQRLPMVCRDAGDVNDDGLVDAADVAHLSSYVLGGNAQPFAPFPDSGLDPTRDTLEMCIDDPSVCP